MNLLTPRGFDTDGLHFVPLGGSDEIGMNLYLYGLDGAWLMVDLGIAFGDATTPGIEVVMPDPAFIEAERDRLLGIVLTHAHEDHFGAVRYLWPRLRVPVYATPFTAAYLRLKLEEAPFAREVEIIEVPLGGRLQLGPFSVEYMTVTHSIPEPNALAIRTRHGTVVHSGDWKLDPRPQIGERTDERAFRRLGEEGVLALICDSTNAMVDGRSGSESEVAEALERLIAAEDGRVAVTCFATNLARVQSIARAAHAAGRHAALVGRSLWRVHEAASQTGWLDVPEAFLTPHDAGFLPRDKVVLICTGSQGEPRAALTRIAEDDHPHIVLEEGDTVIYSSRRIPGNEKAISRVQNLLVRQGVRLITSEDDLVHVSGHPAREELATMYQWLRPRIAIPVHGEAMHLEAHANLIAACQIEHQVVPSDGAVIRLAPGVPAVVGEVRSGRLGLDGERLIALDGEAMRGRHRMIVSGAAAATVVLDAAGRLAADPRVSLLGLCEGDDGAAVEELVAQAVKVALGRIPARLLPDDAAVGEAVRVAVRRAVRALTGKKPVAAVHVVRVGR